MRPPRILVITNSYPNLHKPHAGIYVQRHVQLHRAAGWSVRVLAPDDSRTGLLRNSWKYVKLLARVIVALAQADFDLIHAHWPVPAGLFGLLLSWARGKPFVLTSHGAFVDNYEAQRRPVRWLVRLVLRHAGAVIAVGKDHQVRVQRIGQLSPSQLYQMDMGVWLPEASLSRAKARHHLGLALVVPLVVFIGDLIPRKGVDLLLEAIAALGPPTAPCQVIVGGQGSERPRLHEAVHHLGLAERVHFIGPVAPDDVMTWFAAADVCVIPSRSEPFGLVALEAMAAGTAVLAADVGGLAETIQDGQNGLLFAAGDALSLAARLRELLIDPALREQLAQRGRQTAADHDMRHQADRVAAVYQALLPGLETGDLCLHRL